MRLSQSFDPAADPDGAGDPCKRPHALIAVRMSSRERGTRMPQVTEREIWIRSTDMDGDRIVNNARYFEFFEQARLEHLLALGVIVRPRSSGESDRAFTIAETTCRFLAPLQHRDLIVAQARTTEVRNRSFTLGYRIFRSPEGTAVAEGSSALVWLDQDGRPTALPPLVRAALVDSTSDEATKI